MSACNKEKGKLRIKAKCKWQSETENQTIQPSLAMVVDVVPFRVMETFSANKN